LDKSKRYSRFALKTIVTSYSLAFCDFSSRFKCSLCLKSKTYELATGIMLLFLCWRSRKQAAGLRRLQLD